MIISWEIVVVAVAFLLLSAGVLYIWQNEQNNPYGMFSKQKARKVKMRIYNKDGYILGERNVLVGSAGLFYNNQLHHLITPDFIQEGYVPSLDVVKDGTTLKPLKIFLVNSKEGQMGKALLNLIDINEISALQSTQLEEVKLALREIDMRHSDQLQKLLIGITPFLISMILILAETVIIFKLALDVANACMQNVVAA